MTFTSQDADSFFRRNRAHMTQPHDDIALPLLRMYGIRPRKVLDVGCANGYRLAAIHNVLKCDSYGVDASQMAIDDGKARFPSIDFCCETAYGLPYTGRFDLVTVVFVFHWLGRGLLADTVAEIDRVLQPGGYLLIADFAPDQPEAVPYKHAPGLYTYKQPYHELFTAGLGYRMVAYLEIDHDTRGYRADAPSEDRAFVALLRKNE